MDCSNHKKCHRSNFLHPSTGRTTPTSSYLLPRTSSHAHPRSRRPHPVAFFAAGVPHPAAFFAAGTPYPAVSFIIGAPHPAPFFAAGAPHHAALLRRRRAPSRRLLRRRRALLAAFATTSRPTPPSLVPPPPCPDPDRPDPDASTNGARGPPSLYRLPPLQWLASQAPTRGPSPQSPDQLGGSRAHSDHRAPRYHMRTRRIRPP